MKPKLTESDLEQMFIANRIKRKNPFLVFAKFFLLTGLFFILIFLAINFPAYKQKIVFWYQDQFGGQKQSELSKIVLTPNSTENKSPQIANISDNSIYIEAINIKAPITFRVENDENEVSKNLQKGVIQLAGSALPGEKGNVFITGHSSNYFWAPGQYNSIFALLDKLVVGDLIMVKFQNTNYIYNITDKFVTGPTNNSVIDTYSSKSTLTLMTCSPVGTNLRRLIIRSEQISPDPMNNRPTSATSENKKLPEGVR